MTALDTGFFDRWHADQMKDPEYRCEYELERARISQTDAIMRRLDGMRARAGMSKAQLARAIGKDPAAVRRLFSAQVNPGLETITAMAAALDAEVQIVPRTLPSPSQEDGE